MFCASPAMAVFMPMTCAEEFSSGPPEFPGLIAASVWIRCVRLPESVGICRSVADTRAGSTFATMPRTLVGAVDEAEPDCVVAATGTGTGALRGDHTDTTTAATTRPATSPEIAPAIAPGTIPRPLGAGSLTGA